MTPTTINWKEQMYDLIKGALGAAITAAMLALFNYAGAHIPMLAQACAAVAGGTVGVKVGN